MTSDQGAPTRTRRWKWIRAASDRLPTTWFAGLATAIFLAATAAFGGLASAAEPEPVTIEPGQEHRNDEFAITVERAVVLDDFPEAGAYVDEEENERVLVVQISIENRWSEPLSLSPSSMAQSMQIDEVADTPIESVARYDDATANPWLQPGVPAEIVVTWIVNADAFADGDLLHLTLSDLSLYTGSFVTTGQTWDDPVPAATLTLAVSDLGAGQ